MPFWVGTVRQAQPTRLSDALNLKKFENHMRYQVNFLLLLKLQKNHAVLSCGPKKLLVNQLAEFFTFHLFKFLIFFF